MRPHNPLRDKFERADVPMRFADRPWLSLHELNQLDAQDLFLIDIRSRRTRRGRREFVQIYCGDRVDVWIPDANQNHRQLLLDVGAVRVLKESGRSLLPVGVTAVQGRFNRGEVVSCHSPEGLAIARGLVNYGVEDARKIIGKPSEKIEQLLGYVDEPELIHRDNLVLL